MTAFNIVRYRVRAGQQKAFEDRNREADWTIQGCRGVYLVKTGDVTYVAVGMWDSYQDIVRARPRLIGILDTFRNLLEDIGGNLGVTYAVSGEAVVEVIPGERPEG
jgi:hypothetical protein